VGLIRGLFWVLITPVWYVLDEAHHYAYVENIALGHGPPVVGEDKVSLDVLAIAKNSPTSPARSMTVQPSRKDPGWGVFLEQYEGIQSPLYYFLLSPVYRIWRPFGAVTSIYALRIATVIVSLAAVPLIWYLARLLFPSSPTIGLAAAGVYVLVQGVNSNLASITNDALVVPAAAAAYLFLVRASIRGFGWKDGAITGVFLGGALLTKMTAIPLLAVAAVGVLLLPGSTSFYKRVRFGLVMGVVSFAAVSPWLIRNRVLYGSFTSTNTIELTTASLQPKIPLSFSGLRTHVVSGVTGFWSSQGYAFNEGRTYTLLFGGLVILALIVALATAIRGKDWRGARAAIWLAASFPIALLAMVAIIYAFFDGLGTASGRHLYVALPLLVILVAGGLMAIGPRLGATVLVATLAVLLAVESKTFQGYAEAWYTPGIVERELVPVIDQSYNDGFSSAQKVRMTPPCTTELVGLAFDGKPATELVVSGAQSTSAQLIGTDGVFSLFRFQVPPRSEFELELAGHEVGRSRREREAALSFAEGSDGDPVGRIYCRRSNARDLRFQQIYDLQHPDFLTYSRVVLWSRLWLLGAGVLAGVALVWGGSTIFRNISDKSSNHAPVG
jgi:hypothetical protein